MKKMRSIFRSGAQGLKSRFSIKDNLDSSPISDFDSNLAQLVSERVKITNVFALSLSGSAVLVAVILLFSNVTGFGLLALVVAAVFASVIGLNAGGRTNLARGVLVLSLNLAIYIYSTSLGKESGIHFWFITAAILSFAIFDLAEKFYLFTSITISFCSLGFIWTTDFAYSLLPQIEIDASVVRIISYLMVGLSFGISLSAAYYVVLQYNKSLRLLQFYARQQIKNHVVALNASSIVSHTDTLGKITYVNDNFCHISGYSREELLGSSHSHLISSHHGKDFLKEMRRTLVAKEIWKGEVLHQTKDGHYYWANTTVVPSLGVNNEIQGYVAIHHDVTETKNSELKFRSIFDQASAGMVFLSTEGEVIECNERYAGFFGLPRAQIIGMTPKEMLQLEDQEAKLQEIRELLSGERNHLISERKITRPDGTFIWCLSNAARITDVSGKEVFIAAILQDITQAKILQASLTHSSMMASLGEMAAGVAHEINNPLSIILGRAEQLNRQLQDGQFSADFFKEKLEKIILTCDRIAKIIKGLRSFSRQADKDPMVKIDLKSLTENVLSLCLERFRAKGVDLLVSAIPEAQIEGRAVQIEQVLLNLLNNAFDAVETLSARWVKLEITIQGERLKISVTDSGHGIVPEIVAKIMQPFFTTKEVGKGTGLGLSISKGIVEAHQGVLKYNPDSIHTCFVIDMPLKQIKTEESAA